MQLHPTEQFTISRQLADPDDTDTNYVQATVRNAKTDELLKSVALSNKGSQRFTAVYEVPADVSGQGFWITITTLVYTDAAHTVRNMNYNAEQSTYLVQDRPNKLAGGGHGDDIDYRKLAKVIEKAMEGKNDSGEKVNLDPVFAMLKGIQEQLVSIETKDTKPQPTDLTPVLSAFQALQASIAGIPDKLTKTNLTPLETAISDLTEAIKIAFSNQDTLVQDVNEALKAPVAALTREVGRLKKGNKPPVMAPAPIIKRRETAEDLLGPVESPFFKNTKQ